MSRGLFLSDCRGESLLVPSKVEGDSPAGEPEGSPLRFGVPETLKNKDVKYDKTNPIFFVFRLKTWVGRCSAVRSPDLTAAVISTCCQVRTPDSTND